MVAGGLLLVVTAIRLPSELKDDPKTTAVQPVSDELCVGVPCRANDDRRPARGYEVPSIAVDAKDPEHQVVGDMNLVGGHCGWHVTFDGGETWQDGVFDVPPQFERCTLDGAGFLPMGNVAMGASGENVYAVFTSSRPDNEGDGTLIVTSTDGGKTFSTAREILSGAGKQLSYSRPQLTVVTTPEGVDQLLLSQWGCAPGRCTKGFFLRSDDGGTTFTAPVLVTPDPGGNSPSPPAMGADGTIFMTYLRRFEGNQAEMLVTRSTDGGKTFDAQVIDKQEGIGIQYDSAKIAVDPKRGWVYLTFADERDARPEVFFRRSQDNGVTWERVVRLHTSPGGSALSPAMAVSPEGRIDVVFYRQTRKNIQDVHATFSNDGGKTFAADQKVNDKTIDREAGYWNEVGDDALPAVASTSSTAYFAWSDTRDATDVTDTQEILTKQIARPAA